MRSHCCGYIQCHHYRDVCIALRTTKEIVYRNSLVSKMSLGSHDVMDGMPMQTLVKRQNFLNYNLVEIIILNF